MYKFMNRVKISKLSEYIKGYKWQMFVLIICAVIESAVFVLTPKISGIAVDLLSQMVPNGNDEMLSAILEKVILLFVLYSVYAFATCMTGFMGNIISTGITYKLREDISKKLGKISMNYIDTCSKGDIVSRVVNDVETLSDIFASGLKTIISSVILSVGILVMMFGINCMLTVISLVGFIVFGVISGIIMKCSNKYVRTYKENLGKLNDCISETFRGHEIVKTFGAENYLGEKFEKLNNNLFDSAWKSQFISGIAMPSIEVLNNINYILICVAGGYMVATHGITLGGMAAFIAYAGQVNRPIGQLAGMFGMFQQMYVSAERVFGFLEAPEEENISDINNNEAVLFNNEIVFNGVSFGYEKDKDIIENFSLSIPKGKTVAVVGKTGSGKTTIINLIMRLYRVGSGEILMDERNINEFGIDNYRKLFGVVTQDVWLYSGSIMENIRYGRLTATDNDVREAARLVGADHFIESLPEGYQTCIQEGEDNISEGQKQLIALARMMISDVPILIMDEATASIDSVTEEMIQKSLKKLFEDRTSIVIAHRLSTIKMADIIILIDKGKILEKGNHEELMLRQGEYFRLYNSQFSDNV